MEKVIVCVEQCYSDNNGAFDVVYYWDGESVETETLTESSAASSPSVNATRLQKMEAGDWMRVNSKDINVRNGVATYIGCTVILQRSRKAPNKIELEVINHKDREWNQNYMRYDDDQICVNVDGVSVWVSTGCIKDVVKYRRPWWAK